jgi:hypothetical protein
MIRFHNYENAQFMPRFITPPSLCFGAGFVRSRNGNSCRDGPWYWGIICAAVDIYFSIVSKIPILLTSQSRWIGLIQRGVIVPFMVWVFVFALGMSKVSKETK